MAISKKAKFGGYPILPNRPVTTVTEIGNPTSIADGLEIVSDDVRTHDKREGKWEYIHDGVLVRVQLVDKGTRQYADKYEHDNLTSYDG